MGEGIRGSSDGIARFGRFETGFYLRASHLLRIRFLVKVDGMEVDPVNIAFLGSKGIVFRPYGVAKLIDQLWFLTVHVSFRMGMIREWLLQ